MVSPLWRVCADIARTYDLYSPCSETSTFTCYTECASLLIISGARLVFGAQVGERVFGTRPAVVGFREHIFSGSPHSLNTTLHARAHAHASMQMQMRLGVWGFVPCAKASRGRTQGRVWLFLSHSKQPPCMHNILNYKATVHAQHTQLQSHRACTTYSATKPPCSRSPPLCCE